VRYRNSVDVLLAPYQLKNWNSETGEIESGTNQLMNHRAPQKLFEYMASGTPVVASDFDVLREILNHGENAYLCDPHDLDEWVQQLRRIKENPESAVRAGERAREDFLTKYTYESRTEKLYTKFMKSKL
jgi:glycosyltransferase involved in cell wall biosynthesis